MKHTYDYPRPALTVDCVVLDGSRVLLIKRRDEPFKGMWALPGGYVNEGESAEEAAQRELEEETGLRLVVNDVYHRAASLVQVRAFTTPGRDPRGWVVSVAFVASLDDYEGPIIIKAGDDAAAAEWVEMTGDLFEPGRLAFDHVEILRSALEQDAAPVLVMNAAPALTPGHAQSVSSY